MALLKLLCFAGFVMLLARLGGWRLALPQSVIDTLSFRKPAGQTADDSESDSDESDPGPRSIGDGVAHVYGSEWAPADHPEPPGLAERWTNWLERWSTGRDVVLETPDPEPSDREQQRAELVAHLLRERARTNPSIPATKIVDSCADQDDVPWGRVSRATVWRVWRELP